MGFAGDLDAAEGTEAEPGHGAAQRESELAGADRAGGSGPRADDDRRARRRGGGESTMSGRMHFRSPARERRDLVVNHRHVVSPLARRASINSTRGSVLIIVIW